MKIMPTELSFCPICKKWYSVKKLCPPRQYCSSCTEELKEKESGYFREKED